MFGPVTMDSRGAGARRLRPARQSLGVNGIAGSAHRRLDHRMARALGLEDERAVDHRPNGADIARPILPGRRRRPAAPAPRPRPGSGRASRMGARRARPRRCPAPGARARSAARAILASRSASSTVVKRTWLAMVWRWMKRRRERRLQQRLGLFGGGLDEIAEHGVVADLQRPPRSRRPAAPPAPAITRRLSSRRARVSSSSAETPAATKPPSRA